MKKRNIETLQQKKGFTLVELMIVVVIMGILVAVAIPVYNSASENAREKTCHSNCELIEKAAVQYMATYNTENIASVVPLNASVTITSESKFEELFPEEFVNLFQKGEYPKCPAGETITVYPGENGITLQAYCSKHGNMHGQFHE